MAAEVTGLNSLLSPAGWPHASAEPTAPRDPGRFHALFGRDSAIVSLQVLPVRPDVAHATLRTLAALQGERDDPTVDEEPGKIVHEWWRQAPAHLSWAGWPTRKGELRYYGSADSTPWFLILLASLDERSLADELEIVWRAAAGWLERALEKGAGLIRHGPRGAPGGLVQQGWRDSEDPLDDGHGGSGILNARGEPPAAPLADVDTQAAAVVALRAIAVLSGEDRWNEQAAALGGRIEEGFDAETLAIAGDGERVAGAGSHLGRLLWADALSEGGRERVAERLCRPDVFTPWGLRTLSSEHPAFGPEAYHRGAIWPFDSWLGWGGLRAAGKLEAAEEIRRGVLEAIEAIGDAPELYAVGPEGPRGVEIANRVQAWTVGARWALENEWDGRAPALFD